MSHNLWTPKPLEVMPWVDGIGLETGIDTLSSQWMEGEGAMFATFGSWNCQL
jgi:hypothetical protein